MEKATLELCTRRTRFEHWPQNMGGSVAECDQANARQQAYFKKVTVAYFQNAFAFMKFLFSQQVHVSKNC